jgi:hypothetical protein
MTFADAIKQAVATKDAALAGKWADRMRGLGATYADCQAAAARLTGISAEDFETLMEDADYAEAAT